MGLDQRVHVGKFYEKRGEDYFDVFGSKSGEVVSIEQYDARAAYNHWLSIQFWSDSAPKLIELIQKAAGIAPKFEYGIEVTYRPDSDVEVSNKQLLVFGNGKEWTDIKEHAQAMLKKKERDYTLLFDTYGKPYYTMALVRRPKQEGYEVLRDDA